MGKVFLSHSSSDKKYVEVIANILGKDKAVYDSFSFEIGEKTFDQIVSSLDNSDLFVVFLSDKALDSKWVREELNIAYEKVNLGKLKQIFPIIVDPKITYQDPRIPKWMTQDKDNINLRPIENPIVAYRKIITKLRELDSLFVDEEEVYVGHEQEFVEFQNKYFSTTQPLTCIIASGFEGIGRTSFIKQCLKKCNEFKPFYNPILIDFNKNQSIEDLICKLVEAGYGHENYMSLAKLDMESKINILTSQFKQIQDFKEFVIIKDQGGIIRNQDLAWWINKVIEKIRAELTFGIVSKQHVNSFRFTNHKKIFCVDISELDNANKLRLLQKYADLDRDEAMFFSGCLTGHPMHIKYCAQLINEYGVTETKNKSYLLTEYSFSNAKKIIDSALEALSYASKEDREIFRGYLAFLTSYPNVPVELVLRVNKLNEKYETIYHILFSLCICQKIGATKDIISTSPLICDYYDRSRVKKATDIEKFLHNDFCEFKKNIKTNNIDEYCYSQLDYNLKALIVDDNRIDLDYKYLYPSVIVRSIIELYNSQKYKKVLELCDACSSYSVLWDKPLLSTFYYYYCMSLAHKRDPRVLEIAHSKLENNYILDRNQINFVVGFYYKFISKYDQALEKFKECIEDAPTYIEARREMVEVYITLEDYDDAMIFAKKNYNDYPDNPFNIFQYVKCCMHQQNPDNNLIQSLLKSLKLNEYSSINSRRFYPEAQTLYYRYITNDTDKAIDFLMENQYAFDNKIYYYKNIFDLYEDKRDVLNMEKSYNELESVIQGDETYNQMLLRRKFVIEYFKGQKYESIVSELNISRIGDCAKRQILKHLNYLFGVRDKSC